MPEPCFTNAEFDVGSDNMIFCTQTNGDKIIISGLDFNPELAATIAYLTNVHKVLKVEIKIKV